MIIYLDLFIIQNLIFNILIIFLTGKFIKQKTNIKRYFFAASFGALYALISILSGNKLLLSKFVKTITTLIMILIAYLPSSLSQISNEYFSFIIIAACAGGLATMINAPKTFFIQLATLCTIIMFIYLFIEIYNRQKTYKTYICKIKIKIEETVISTNAFIDTGNTLKDSVSGESVIFVSMNLLNEKLSEDLIKILKAEVLEIDEKYNGKIKMIEYRTINNDENILIGIKADNVIIETEKCIIKNEKIIIAPTEQKLKKCEALIGMNILEEGYVYGDTASFEIQSKEIMG